MKEINIAALFRMRSMKTKEGIAFQ